MIQRRVPHDHAVRDGGEAAPHLSTPPSPDHERRSAPAPAPRGAGHPPAIASPPRLRRRCGIATSRRDSDLEAFSPKPADGSLAPLAPQPNARTRGLNLRFLSY